MLTVAVAQFAPGADQRDNLTEMARLATTAADRGARLVVFPEYSSYFAGPAGPDTIAAAEPLDGPFVTALSGLAARLGLHITAGLVERAGAKVANTAVTVDGSGLVAVSGKLHLYDAFGERESDVVTAAEIADPQVFEVGGIAVGVQTCYDIRFPEVTRRLVDAGADLVLVPAEWVRGPLKEYHWATLLAARAIENTVYVAAADHAPPIGVGGSTVLDPMGVALAMLGEQVGEVAVATVTAQRIAAVREKNPALANRRFRVVPR